MPLSRFLNRERRGIETSVEQAGEAEIIQRLLGSSAAKSSCARGLRMPSMTPRKMAWKPSRSSFPLALVDSHVDERIFHPKRRTHRP